MIPSGKAPDPEVATLIDIALMCRRFNALPHEGGILDQDHLLIRKLALVFDALDEAARKQSKKPPPKSK